jgi:hypothetical protein
MLGKQKLRESSGASKEKHSYNQNRLQSINLDYREEKSLGNYQIKS